MFEQVPPLSVLSFFNLHVKCHYVEASASVITEKKYKLPSTCNYLQEEEFAKVFIGYNEQKILLHVEVDKPFEECHLNEFRKGDSLELFFDTRDLKDKEIISQFHHHFVFFLTDQQKGMAREITRFRTDEIHPICDPKDLKLQGYFGAKSYRLDIEILSGALHGYDPSQFQRLGFTYRINRKGKEPQHFSVSSNESKIEQHPSLWASLTLEK